MPWWLWLLVGLGLGGLIMYIWGIWYLRNMWR